MVIAEKFFTMKTSQFTVVLYSTYPLLICTRVLYRILKTVIVVMLGEKTHNFTPTLIVLGYGLTPLGLNKLCRQNFETNCPFQHRELG